MTADAILVANRRIAAAAMALGAAERRLRALSPDADNGDGSSGSLANPLAPFRDVATVAAAEDLPGNDEVAEACRTWIRELALRRVCWPHDVAAASAFYETPVEVGEPEGCRATPRHLLSRAWAERSSERADAWLHAIAEHGETVSDARRAWAEVREEGVRRMYEHDGPAGHELPASVEALRNAAYAFLDGTDDALAANKAKTAGEALLEMLGRRAGEGWPAHLTARWCAEPFVKTGLLDAVPNTFLMIPIRPLGASSFGLALGALGELFARAELPGTMPFSWLSPPFATWPRRRAALFSQLVADPVFQRRRLGLGRARAESQAREIAAAALLRVRLLAVQVLLVVDGAWRLPRTERQQQFEGLTERALGAAWPGGLAYVLPRVGPVDLPRWAGLCVGLGRDLVEVVGAFDEDWFDNPRAATWLRDEQHRVPHPRRLEDEVVVAAATDLAERWSQRLG